MKIGFANGCFDLFHEGHRHYLTECRRHCDYLIVAVNSDAYCTQVKGADRPFEPLQTRMNHVRAFSEAVVPFEGQEVPLIFEICPQVVFKAVGDGGLRGYSLARDTGDVRIPIVRIGRLEGFSTTLAAQQLAGERDEVQRDAPPARPG